jgi:hypothetical protein
MSRSVLPWVLAGGAAAAILYFATRRADGRVDTDDGSTREPHEPEPRNAGLSYRPIGRTGEAYPDWVRALRGKSGVYVIRERKRDGSVETVYIGESHRGRLYQTLTRHFSTWRRSKRFWAGQYGGQGHDPGLTYPRDKVLVAARVMSPDRAITEEARLIARLRPRDNLLGQPDEQEEVVPF